MPNFSTPLSGLQAESSAIEIVGNNLANLNTTGFKASSASFRDVIAASLGAGASNSQIGLGVQPPTAVRKFTQGSIQLTSGAFNAAVQGDGFFVVKDSVGRQLYTRAGDFKIDAGGNMLTSAGDHVQGWSTTAGGVVVPTGGVSDIVIPLSGTRKPLATSVFSSDLNLDASSTVGTAGATFSTPVEVVDSLGTKHVLTLNFTKTAANAWDYTVTIPGAELTAGTPGTPSTIKSGSITFSNQGILTSPAAPPPATNGVIAVTATGLKDGAADLAMNWSFYDANFKPRLSQYSQASSASATNQDGLVAANLLQISLADGGTIIAQYTGGRQEVVAQLALASIPNPDSLAAVGDNNFEVTFLTAQPTIGTADTGGRGKIIAGSLEASTVDIAKEFTNLIVYQRGYQANSRMITTLDEISQDTINLKR